MERPDRGRSILILILIYAGTLLATILAGSLWPFDNLLSETFILDVLATVIIFIFSVIFNNSSTYDPYWSMAPPAIVVFWMLEYNTTLLSLRHVLILFLFIFWSSRLTFNFFRRWQGFGHEDWRYEDIRRDTGKKYWIASFLGIHLLPTVIVFLALIPVYFAIAKSSKTINLIDLAAFTVTVSAILIEMIADRQLHNFLKSGENKGTTMQKGLWRLVRHPNYSGEVLFWWGMYLFVIAAAPGYWWTIFGPVVMTLLFFMVSVPLMDKHMTDRRSDFSEYKKHTPALIPGLLKKHDQAQVP